MAFKIIRNSDGNYVSFEGSSAPIFFNSALTAEVDSSDSTLVNVVNVVGTGDSSDKTYEYFRIPYTQWQDRDGNSFNSAAEVVTYFNAAANVSSNIKSGYWYQNSSYYEDGNNHDTNVDVVTEVDEGVNTLVKATSSTANESGMFMPEFMDQPYDRATGTFTLHDFKPNDMILFRFDMDIEPESDECSATMVLECTSSAASGGTPFTFYIEEQILSMSDGASIDYPGLVSIPVFIGQTLNDKSADGGTVATIVPKIRLNKTRGILKPRGFLMFVWR